MATNVKYDRRAEVTLELAVGASKSAGDVLQLNDMPVFLLNDSDSDNLATCVLLGVSTVVELTVTGEDGSGNSAVAVGEAIYIDGSAYNKDNANGAFIGYALETVTSGASTAIDVALVGGLSALPDGVTSTPAELNLNDGQVADADFTIGADAGTTIAVAIQLLDAAGDDMATRACIPWYLSSDANGDAIASATSGGIAIGTDGLLIEWTANVAGMVTSEADGDIDVVLTEAGAGTWYLVLVMPNGKLVVSGAITFS